MPKFNILRHIDNNFSIEDSSNVWRSEGITEIPMFTPNSISTPEGVPIYNLLPKFFLHTFYDPINQAFTAVLGPDPHGRYILLKLVGHETFVQYKFAGRSFPQVRSEPSWYNLDNKIYMSGGRIGNDALDEIWVYDFDTNKWSIIGRLPSPRFGHSLVFVPVMNRWVLFGGNVYSRIDNRELLANDLLSIDKDFYGDWEIHDKRALLPHERGNILGCYNDEIYIYIKEEQKIYHVSLLDDSMTSEDAHGPVDLSSRYILDSVIGSNSYFLFSTHNYHLLNAHILDFDSDTHTFSIRAGFEANILATPPEGNNDVIQSINLNSLYRVSINSDTVGAELPALFSGPRVYSDTHMVCTDGHVLQVVDLNTMKLTRHSLGSLSTEGLCLSWCSEDNYFYVVGWTNQGILRVGRISLDPFQLEKIYEIDSTSNDDVPSKRNIIPGSIVHKKFWIVGGASKDSILYDQWSFNIDMLEWSREKIVEKIPPAPFLIFTWRDRLWCIPNGMDGLYRYYPSMMQWTRLDLQWPIDSQLSKELNYEMNFDVVNNSLFIAPTDGYKFHINLESRRVQTPQYDGDLLLALSEIFLVNIEGYGYIADSERLAPIVSHQPPHFENYLEKWDLDTIYDVAPSDPRKFDGYVAVDIQVEVPYILSAYDHLGRYRPLYTDGAGSFWVDNNKAFSYDFDTGRGFYAPEVDMKGEPGDTKRRIPTMLFEYRDVSPVFGGINDGVYNMALFIARPNYMSKFRASDGTFFNYNAPVSSGSCVGIHSSGQVYIFGGLSSDVKSPRNIDQMGFEVSNDLPDGGERLTIDTLVVYDLNYVQGEIEYLQDIPDFYERHDYDVAAKYLMDRYKDSLDISDQTNIDRYESMKDNYYLATQAILDDIAVRYITMEGGTRPSGRTYAINFQHEDALYVCGGCEVISPPASGPCPPLHVYNPIQDQTLYKFDMSTRTWTNINDTPFEKLYGGSAAVNKAYNEAWVIGGFGNSLYDLSNAIYIYNIDNNSWTQFDNVPKNFDGRAMPNVYWIDDDYLLIQYGTIIDTTIKHGCLFYKTTAFGDRWMIHRPTMTMYKISVDIPKSLGILPIVNGMESIFSALYIPPITIHAGGYENLAKHLVNTRIHSTEWEPYEEKYQYVLKSLYDLLYEYYKDKVYPTFVGEETSINIPEFDGSNSIVEIYNQIWPDMAPDILKEIYLSYIEEFPQRPEVRIPDIIIPLVRAHIKDIDFNVALIITISRRIKGSGSSWSGRIYQSDIMTTLDSITGSLYPANYTSKHDMVVFDISLYTGEVERVRKVITPKYFNFTYSGESDSIIDTFVYKDQSTWLSIYSQDQLRLYKFSDRPDGDLDLLELVVDVPVSFKPVSTAYDGKDHLLCLFDANNVWSLDLSRAIITPNDPYWRRLPPMMSIGHYLSDHMYHVLDDDIVYFCDNRGVILSYRLDTNVWNIERQAIDRSKVDFVAVDGKELYYLGDKARYFNLYSMQGDRFIIYMGMCEYNDAFGLPNIGVRRNKVLGFDINNNILGAFTRKQGSFDKSWSFPNYIKIRRILISVDYDTLDQYELFEIYTRRADGIHIESTYPIRDSESWDYDDLMRVYSNGKRETQVPDQFIAADVDDYISDVQVVFQPRISNSGGYIVKINEVLLEPFMYDGLMATDYFIALEDICTLGVYNTTDDDINVKGSSDNGDLVVSKDRLAYGDKVDMDILRHRQSKVSLKSLHSGSVAHLMFIRDRQN